MATRNHNHHIGKKKGIKQNIPNKLTAKTLRETEEGKNLHKVLNFDELLEDLEIE